MEALFRIKRYRTPPNGFRAYWIESSAPLNVDDKVDDSAKTAALTVAAKTLDGNELEDMPDPDQAIADIAAYLSSCKNPQIVISIHGFNNPLEVVEKRFQKAYQYLIQDKSITNQAELVCIGYRWPSEEMGSPRSSILKAAPRGLIWVFGVALGMLGLGAGLSAPRARSLPGRNVLHSLLYALGSLLVAVPFTAFLMRVSAYFRDAYRAVNYGVPDLLEVIRHLDKAVHELDKAAGKNFPEDKGRPAEDRIKLSFIGHSMGGFVVTSLVRILTDVFSAEGMTSSLKNSAVSSAAPAGKEAAGAARAGDADGDSEKVHQVGHVYTLERLVLVSPDIPAETLLQGRANFLQSSLSRFREAYLFCNEGDEALRLISTIGNYFSFPTTNRDFGYRLGSVNIVKPPRPGKPEYGIVNLKRLRAGRPLGETCVPLGTPWTEAQQFLCDLRAGHLTLAKLAELVQTTTADAGVQGDNVQGGSAGADLPLPARFTYFDCTDYKDQLVQTDGSLGSKVIPIMTFARRKATLSDWNHFCLLCSYLFSKQPDKPDGHSGYFSAPFTQCLIYRLSCLGLEGLLQSTPPLPKANSGLDGWSDACKTRQIQSLLSPVHYDAFTLEERSQTP